MNTKFLTACFFVISIPSLAFSANGKPFAVMQAQIDALNSRIAVMEASTSTNTDDISQIAANSNQNASKILDNTIAIGNIEDNFDALILAVRRESKCLELRILAIESIELMYDELFRLRDGESKEITWFSYTCDDTFQIVATEHTKTMDASAIRLAMGDVQYAAICIDDDVFQQLELQGLLQEYARTLQMLSNMMKIQNDVLVSILRNFK